MVAQQRRLYCCCCRCCTSLRNNCTGNMIDHSDDQSSVATAAVCTAGSASTPRRLQVWMDGETRICASSSYKTIQSMPCGLTMHAGRSFKKRAGFIHTSSATATASLPHGQPAHTCSSGRSCSRQQQLQMLAVSVCM